MLRGLSLFAAMMWAAGAMSARADDAKKPFDDTDFVAKAASGGMCEVAVGKIAETQAKTDAVKKFAQRIVKDHSKANEQLKQVAKAANIALPTAMNDHDQKNLEQFKNYKGQNFDQDYVNAMVEDHTQDIALFTQASKEAKDPAIRKFATQTLPTLKSHLEAAKKLQK